VQPGSALDGSEFYYRKDQKMMAVAVARGKDLVAGKPKSLFEIEKDRSGHKEPTTSHRMDDS
jgi:hypothetical protein